MPSLKHTHSYIKWRRQKSDGRLLFKCADPHCTHFAPRDALMGKASICPACKKEEFILDNEALKRSKPLCLYCRNTKEGKEFRQAQSVLENLFKLDEESA